MAARPERTRNKSETHTVRICASSVMDYLVLGHTADQWHGSSNGGKCQEKEAQGRFAMNIIDTDRATMALETGRYSRVELCQLFPPSCTPKNNLIIGYRKE